MAKDICIPQRAVCRYGMQKRRQWEIVDKSRSILEALRLHKFCYAIIEMEQLFRLGIN